MSSSTIKILVVEVGKEPEVREIENTLPAMQKIVGGYIEGLGLEPNVHLVCNEEGKLQGLPINRPFGNDILVGDFFITRYNKRGDNVSLKDDDIVRYTKIFQAGFGVSAA